MNESSQPSSQWVGWGRSGSQGGGVQTQREHSVELKVHLSKNKTRSQVRKRGRKGVEVYESGRQGGRVVELDSPFPVHRPKNQVLHQCQQG